MLDLKLVQKNPEILSKALKDRHSELDVAEFQKLDAKRRELLQKVEDLKSKRNQASAVVAEHKRSGEDITEYVQELSKLSDTIKSLDVEVNQAKEAVKNWMLRVPNIPDISVPFGKDENDNVEVRRVGEIRYFDFPVREHGEIGETLRGFDFERAAKLSGSRFVVSYNWVMRILA